MAENQSCSKVEGYSIVRFTLLSFASITAIIGIVFNALLSWLFLGPRKIQFSTSTFYQGVLAVFDLSLCLFYIAIFQVDAFAYYLNMEAAYDFLFSYIKEVFLSSRVTQLVIPYLLVVTTLDRMLSMYEKTKGISSCISNPGGRKIIAASIIIVAILFRIPLAIAMVVIDFPNCSSHLRSKELSFNSFSYSDFYLAWDFYFLSAIQTFVPFVALLTMNVLIISRMTVTRKAKQLTVMKQQISAMSQGRRKRALSVQETLKLMIFQDLFAERVKIRSAISTVAMISSSHLIINSMNLVVVFLERFYSSLLMVDEFHYHPFYTHFGDVISFLFVLISVLRLPIYVSCNQEVRSLLYRQFRSEQVDRGERNKTPQDNEKNCGSRKSPSNRSPIISALHDASFPIPNGGQFSNSQPTEMNLWKISTMMRSLSVHDSRKLYHGRNQDAQNNNLKISRTSDLSANRLPDCDCESSRKFVRTTFNNIIRISEDSTSSSYTTADSAEKLF